MHRSRALTLPLIAVAAAALTLTGCSSDSGSGPDTALGGAEKESGGSSASAPADAGKDDADAEPKGSGKGLAHLTYTGGATGEFTIESVGCAVINGKLATISAPDSNDPTDEGPPSFNGIVNDGDIAATLTTKDDRKYFRAADGIGINSAKKDGAWVVTVTGLELAPADLKGDPIIVEATFICGTVAEI